MSIIFFFCCPALYDFREKFVLPHVVDGTDDPVKSLFATAVNHLM